MLDREVCWDQVFLSMSFLQIRAGLLAACLRHWAKCRAIVSRLIMVRLAWEAGMNTGRF